MKLSELLTKAKERIDTPEKWMKNDYRDADEHNSTCWCSFGAIDSVGRELVLDDRHMRGDAITLLSLSVPRNFIACLITYNDDPKTTHEDVMTMFDGAITLAKNKETK